MATAGDQQAGTSALTLDQLTQRVSAKIADRDTELVGRLGKLIDTKLDNFRDEFRAGNNDNQNVKSIAEKYLEPRAFKKKGNEKQFTINAQVLECLDQAVSAVDKNKLDKAKETLKTGIEILKNRQKLIVIADSEKLGWRVADEYETNELASDDEDEKQLWKSANRAERKAKEDQREKSCKRPRSATAFATTSPVPIAPMNLPFSTLSAVNVPQAQRRRYIDKSRDVCRSCGRVGHWSNECTGPLPTVPSHTSLQWRHLS